MDNQFELCSALVTSLEQDGFLIKIHAQLPSSGVSARELLSRVEQISGHLRRVKSCESISRGQLAFARIDDNFHRVRALGDNVEGRVAVKFIDFGHEDVLLLTDIVVVDPPLSDVLTTLRPLAEEFYLDGILLMRPLSNEEIVALSEKILYKTVSSRLRRCHPDLTLIELATTNAAGDRHESFSNIIVELGFGNKCAPEDIAKYLRIKIPARVDDPAMQSGRPYTTNNLYSVPPPPMLGSQSSPMLGSPPTNMLGSQSAAMPPNMLGSQPVAAPMQHSSVNARLSRFKKDAALGIPGSGPNMYSQASPSHQLADRKQYAVTDGRTCTTAPTLAVNSRHNAYISHVEDGPFNFTIQLKSSVEDLLPKLRNMLVRYQNSPITVQLIPGSVVMAKSSDETLRRGVIMNVQPETCKVYYIDYGNFEELPYSDIFQLPNTAAELSPAMAMQFCLADLKSMKITDSNKDYFARLLLGKQVLIRVTERESNSPFQYCEILWEGRNVREILMNLNSPMQYSYQYPPRGREAPVSVIYVDGPSQFFVQYRSELNVANQIQEALASYCPSQPRVVDLSSISIGSPVASIFPDDQRWYRALVMGMDTSSLNVFYVDYGNRAEVTPNQICLLSRELVTTWKTQAIECCLIGFDTVTPDLYMAEKMEETVLGHSYTLRLHSILSGFRLSVDLLDEQHNSIAAKMKNLLNERQKAISQTTAQSDKKKAQPTQDDDRLSQHSSNSIRMAIGVYEPPPAKAQKSTKSGDSGGKKNKFQRPGTRGDRVGKSDQRGDRKFEERNKFEDRANPFSQHDDRSGNDYKPRNDSRMEWKKGAKKPYMDQANEWENSNQEPKPFARQDSGGGGFKKQDWKNDDKPGWGGDSSNRGSRPDRGDRQGGGFRSDTDRKVGSNRFDRKPFNADEDGRNGDRGDTWGSRDRKFGDRDNKFGDRDNKFGGRDNKFGDRENKFGDRENKFGDRDNNRYGGRDNKFGDRDNKFGGRDKPNVRDSRKPKWNEDAAAVQRTASTAEDSWEETQPPVKRPSVVISEYPHQVINIGQAYKVLFAGMENSPREVYVQLSDCDSTLDKIRSMIDADSTATSRPISNIVLAMPVLARFQDDGLLYRATIKSTSKVSSGKVDVLFVDFGNTSVNAINEVFAISSELMSIPIQAIHVTVTDMPTTPFANLAACQAKFETDYLTLKPSRTTTINLEQVIEGILIRPDGQSVADSIKNDPSCHGEAQFAAAPESQLASADVLELQATAPEAETSALPPIPLWRERLDLLLGQRLLAKVVKKYKDDHTYSIKITAVLDLIVPAQSTDSLSSELTQGTDIIVAVDSLVEDRLLVKYYNRQGHSLGQGDAIESIVPMQIMQRKGEFTISHREGSTIYLQNRDSIALSNLLERLFEKYDTSASGSHVFKEGDVCAAKSFDGNWYRAKMLRIVENMCTVHYIDYGNDEEIEVGSLRKLDEEFSCPAMCVSVVLPVTYKDVEGCLETLGEGPFECSFIKLDPVNGLWIVDLCTIGEPKENLACKWIEAGKAESLSDISADPKRREPWWNLKKGDRVPVIISHVETPDVFFAQLLEQSCDLEALQNLIHDLPEGGDLGEIFVAKYTLDSLWYRAVRHGEEVRFLDYGNCDTSVQMKNLPANLVHPTKGYAMPLRLCVRSSGDQWTEAAGQIFDNFVDKTGLEAEIISVDFEIIVDLRVGEESLSTIFINGGHAVYFSTPMNNDLGGCILEDDLPVGNVTATVSALTSVNDFYIQENSKIAVLNVLASKLEAANAFDVLDKPPLGQYLVAKFVDDSMWYRAKVINEDPIEVLFLDYGNVSPASEFRVLPLEVAAFPALSWHCSVNIEDNPTTNDLFTNLVDADTVFDVSFKETKDDLHIVQLSVNGNSPFEQPAVSESKQSEIPSSTEQITEEQTKPIPPPLTKSLYKDCVLCHSNGPYDFYIQTDDDHIQIDEMANALFEAGTFPKIDNVKKGDFVVAQFTEDDAYYRAVVTDIEPEVVVHFVDYGNSCPASCFHELPAPLKEIPQLAVRCSLQSPNGGWSVDAIDKFTSLLNPETKSFDLKIISRGEPTIVDVEINGSSITKELESDAKTEPDSIQEKPSAVNDEGVHLSSSGLCYIASVTPKECYIHDSSSSADLDIITEQIASIDISDVNCELKDVKVGDLVGALHEDSLYRARITKLDPPEVFFIDYGNTSPVSKFFKLPEPLSNKEPLAIKVKLDLGEGVVLNDDGVTELQNLAVDGGWIGYKQTKPSVVELSIGDDKVADLLKSYLVIADSSPTVSETLTTSVPVTTDQIPITISHVNSPSDFYYQPDIEKVNEMTSRLADAEGFSPIEKCEVGKLICAKYPDDGLWYRGKVLTTEPVTVMFVDYGNISEVKEMKKLPDDLAEIPPLSTKASLETQEQQWTEEESNKFLEVAYGDADFSCAIIKTTADVVVISLNSSEVGDVLTYMGRNCSIKTSDSEYGTPEVLSVDDVAPQEQHDGSAADGSFSSTLIDQQIMLLSNPDEQTPPQPINQLPESHAVQCVDLVEPVIETSPSKISSSNSELFSVIHVEDNFEIPRISCDESVPLVSDSPTQNLNELESTDVLTVVEPVIETSPSKVSSSNSELFSVIDVEDDIEIPRIGCDESVPLVSDSPTQNLDELESTDTLTVLAKSNQSSPTKSVTPESLDLNFGTDQVLNIDGVIIQEDVSDDVMDRSYGTRENSELAKDGEIIQSLASAFERACVVDGSIGTSVPSLNQTIEEVDPENESLAEGGQDVDHGSLLESIPTALMPPQISQVGLIQQVGSLDSPSSVELEASPNNESCSLVEKSTADILPASSEVSVPLESGGSQNVPASSSFFKIPNLRETLFSAMGYDSSVTSEVQAKTVSDPPNSSGSSPNSGTELVRTERSEKMNYSETGPCELLDSSTGSTTLDQPSKTSEFDKILENGKQSDEYALSHGGDVVVVTIEEGLSPMDFFKSLASVEQLRSPPCKEAGEEAIIPSNLCPELDIAGSHIITDSPGNTSSQDVGECIFPMTFEQYKEHLIAEAFANEKNEFVAGYLADVIDDLTEEDLNADPSDFVKHIFDIFENSKTELNVVGTNIEVDPVAKVEGVEKSTVVSKEQEIDREISESGFCKATGKDYVDDAELLTQHFPISEKCMEEVDSAKVDGIEVVRYGLGDTSLASMEQLRSAACKEARVEAIIPSNLCPELGVTGSHVKPDSSENTSNQDVAECIFPMTFEQYKAHHITKADDLTEEDILNAGPSESVDKFENSKMELNVVGSNIEVDPVTKVEGVEKSTVSKEQEIDRVKPSTNTSSIITEPSKRIPVKTLAQIKASAKARISTGRTVSSNSKTKPTSKTGSPSTPKRKPSSSPSPLSSPKEKDRIIPGAVNGNIV